MSSTEPPSRVPPREGTHESKAIRDKLSSKGKVEKVREVDPDEETRKKRFLKYYHDEPVEDTQRGNRPSPFDLYSEGDGEKKPEGSRFGAARHSSLPNVENAVVPGPTNTPPPNLGAEQEGEEESEGDEFGVLSTLPQAADFWEDVNLPDQPLPPENDYQETTGSSNRSFISKSPDQNEERSVEGTGKKKTSKKVEDVKDIPIEILAKKKKVEKDEALVTPTTAKKREEHEKLIDEKKKKKVEQVSRQKETRERIKDQKNFEEKPTSGPKVEKISPRPRKHAKKEKEKAEQKEQSEAIVTPQVKPETEERGFQGGHKREPKMIEIESLSSLPLPQQVVPIAQAATTQAAHYLHPTTVSLFFQMVGTIYVMQSSGVNRTEIVLNNPSYSGSKFFGSTNTIEKYATAPDSFNIRLTGSNQAVVAFKKNLPSLMTAFENSNIPFRVNRLDVEYTMDRPVFRRKEKQDRGDAGAGDLGEKRR